MTTPGEQPLAVAAPSLRRTTKQPPNRQRRSLRWLVGVTAAAAFAAAATGWLAVRLTRPEVRCLGEELPEITRALACNLPPDVFFPRFTDVTAAASLAGFSTFRNDRSSQLPENIGPGAA